MYMGQSPQSAIATIPPAPWAVGVSGGADSVALLRLLRERAELRLHAVHLDHQLRGAHSDDDARFVAELAASLSLPSTIARREDIEAHMPDLPANPSARYRALRLELFRRVVREQHLSGVILAHHADDQAETILHRLLRGSGPAGLRGMSADTVVSGLRILRPLLCVRRDALREHLRRIGQRWREDASNTSPKYARNRLRQFLAARPELLGPLLELGRSAGALRQWATSASPVLPESFAARELADLPSILADAAARNWLTRAGCPRDLITPETVEQLRTMAGDAATPPRQDFPGHVTIRRRAGRLSQL